MRDLLRKLTVAQWDAIDEEHIREPFDRRALWVFLALAVSLILSRYMGQSRFFDQWTWARELTAGWPYPELYRRLYWALFKTVNYVVVALLVIKLVYREQVLDFGFRGSITRRVLYLYLAMFIVVMVATYIASYAPAFQAKYPKYPGAGNSIAELLIWESAYAYQFFLLEFFFRGFMLFALARYCGHIAIFIVLVPYVMIHFEKPLAETLGSVVAGIALGTLSLRTRSIYGGVLLHVTTAWAMDLWSLLHKGQLQKLFAG